MYAFVFFLKKDLMLESLCVIFPVQKYQELILEFKKLAYIKKIQWGAAWAIYINL